MWLHLVLPAPLRCRLQRIPWSLAKAAWYSRVAVSTQSIGASSSALHCWHKHMLEGMQQSARQYAANWAWAKQRPRLKPMPRPTLRHQAAACCTHPFGVLQLAVPPIIGAQSAARGLSTFKSVRQCSTMREPQCTHPGAHMAGSWCPTAGVRRFITRAQVAAMGMSHLVGTPLLRAYMHGYFVHQRLWQKAVGLAPGTSAAAAQRSAAVAQQLEAQRASRITLLKRLPKVGGPAVRGGMWWDRGLVLCCWRALAASQGLRGLWWGAVAPLGGLDEVEQGCGAGRSAGRGVLVRTPRLGTPQRTSLLAGCGVRSCVQGTVSTGSVR